MSRFVRAAALSPALLSLASVDAAAAVEFTVTCSTSGGANVTITNDTGMQIPKGSRLFIDYHVKGKFDRREILTLDWAIPVNGLERLSYHGPALSACAAVVKFPAQYEPRVNPHTKGR
ncbi:MAG: hypothetical protein KF889_07985 [Alphaproteobacteria bacterium]|nr:hypothetical protein [Alphaproteobacteria bacterium]MCW5740758.1 hypothetical protein [Alphaproteobacteria bacterium]